MGRIKTFDEVAALDKALQLFWQKGFAATSMQDLVDAMQISRSSLYTTYGDKETIYIKALKAYKARTSEVFVQQIVQSETPLDTIKDMILQAIHQSDQGPCSGCFMVNAMCEDPQMIPGLQDLTAQNVATVIDHFTTAFLADGQSDPLQARQKARILFSLHTGTLLLLKQGISKKEATESFITGFDALKMC